jgi:hypothetical protein
LKALIVWLREKKWLARHPLDLVKGIGKARHGELPSGQAAER